jgi:hypothetical protein
VVVAAMMMMMMMMMMMKAGNLWPSSLNVNIVRQPGTMSVVR